VQTHQKACKPKRENQTDLFDLAVQQRGAPTEFLETIPREVDFTAAEERVASPGRSFAVSRHWEWKCRPPPARPAACESAHVALRILGSISWYEGLQSSFSSRHSHVSQPPNLVSHLDDFATVSARWLAPLFLFSWVIDIKLIMSMALSGFENAMVSTKLFITVSRVWSTGKLGSQVERLPNQLLFHALNRQTDALPLASHPLEIAQPRRRSLAGFCWPKWKEPGSGRFVLHSPAQTCCNHNFPPIQDLAAPKNRQRRTGLKLVDSPTTY